MHCPSESPPAPHTVQWYEMIIKKKCLLLSSSICLSLTKSRTFYEAYDLIEPFGECAFYSVEFIFLYVCDYCVTFAFPVQADKEFVWSLWKRLQVANPDLSQAITLVLERWVKNHTETCKTEHSSKVDQSTWFLFFKYNNLYNLSSSEHFGWKIVL